MMVHRVSRVGDRANRVGGCTLTRPALAHRCGGMRLAIDEPMVRLLARWVLMAWLVAACGGQTEGGRSEAPEPEPDRVEGNEGNEGKWSSPGVEGDTPLGECVLGWLADFLWNPLFCWRQRRGSIP